MRKNSIKSSKIILELTSKNIQRAFREYGLGAHDAAGALFSLFREAKSMMEQPEPAHSKGVSLLKYCYEKFEAFIKHIEGAKVDVTDKAGVEALTGAQLEKLLADIQIDNSDKDTIENG